MIRLICILITLSGILIFPEITRAEEVKDSTTTYAPVVYSPNRYIHRIGLELRPGTIFQANPFLKGENENWKPIRNSFSAHLKYSFGFHPSMISDRIYPGVYQGIGLGYYTFSNWKEIGAPVALYIYQGARIARLAQRVSLDYEWNFGFSTGWKPYDYYDNYWNNIIGSRINAYLNVNFFLSWMLTPQFDLTTGVALTHFSNGNTKYPNAGLNTIAFKVGLVYNFNRDNDCLKKNIFQPTIPEFPRHISYDLVLFGSWRRKGVNFGDYQVASPESYPVVGFNFAPMYNFNYKLRAGVSFDGVLDRSSNVYTEDYIMGTTQEFYKPPVGNQLALGISGRAEYVMPYFTVGLGVGTNVLHGGGDLKFLYQILALKIELTQDSFLHIGYSLRDFHEPNYLMLGIGYRFNNKYPKLYRR